MQAIPRFACEFVCMHVFVFMIIYIKFKQSFLVASLILICFFVLGIYPWIMMTMIFKARTSI